MKREGRKEPPAQSPVAHSRGASRPPLLREAAPGLHLVSLPRESFTEWFVTLPRLHGEEPRRVFERLDERLRREPGWRVVRQEVFGLGRAPVAQASSLQAFAPSLGQPHLQAGSLRYDGWPVTCVGPVANGAAAGLFVHVLSGASVKTLHLDGQVAGAVFQDPYCRYCLLGGLTAGDTTLPRPRQALATFERMEAGLRLAGMDFSHVVRTWLYLDQILSWYGEFNRVRTDFFKEKGVFNGLVPASTGVGAANPAGAAVVAGVMALAPKDSRVRIQPVASPLQGPATAYGSSFSRAVEVSMPDHRRLLVSGTASIDREGHTRSAGDLDGQVAHTMAVVAAILKSRGMDWTDVVRTVVYVKDSHAASALQRHSQAHRLPPFPALVVQGDICRPDLLFEIEVDAVVC